MSSWLVVGLGNPGPTYDFTRHNIGYLAVDELCRRANAPLATKRLWHANVSETRLSSAGWGVPAATSTNVTLMTSRTFMNDSGRAVGAVCRHFKIPADHVIVLHDELDLGIEQLRLKIGGGDNGHNGLKSIRAHLSTGDFHRVRMGIGRPTGRMSGADYVLGKFRADEEADVAIATDRAADAVEMIIRDGLVAAQNKFNS